ncbi:MAG: Asp-tRNA(Asn)/Glu-tRNA(Gln) amidotransferase GatCAB subunit B, partial [Bacteroidota bacterium]
PTGSDRFGTRVEVKNLNSINHLVRAIKHEIVRQANLLEQGQAIRQETRLWDHGRQKTFPMRDKESVTDYRYFPEPDMPPIVLSQEKIAQLKSAQPALPAQRWNQYQSWGVPANEALVIVEDLAWAEYFEAVCESSQDAKGAGTWVLGPLRTLLKEQSMTIAQCPLSPQSLAQLIQLVQEGKLSFTLAKEQLLPLMMAEPQGDPQTLAEQGGLLTATDSGELTQAMQALMDAYPAEVQRYKKGKKNLKGFFVGQLMRTFKGKADPRAVNQVVQRSLDG